MDKKQVKVFYVPFGYRGFTTELLKTATSEIKDKDYSKILYLAPTPGKIKEAQKAFHGLIKGTYIPPDMTTIKQFSKKLYSSYGDKRVISKPLTPIIISSLSNKGLGFATIIGSFIDEIKQYRPDKDIDAIQSELRNVFTELNVPEEGSKRAMDAIDIFRRYQDILGKYNIVDENDVLDECIGLIEGRKTAYDTLVVDSFYEITPLEERILKTMISKLKSVFMSIPQSDNFADITNSYINYIKHNFNHEEDCIGPEKAHPNQFYIAYPGIDDEVEGIARHVKHLYISGRYRSLDNITIAFPKLNTRVDMIQRVFARYGIPCTFSMTKPLARTRPFLDLFAMLDAVANDYPRAQFSRFLASQYFKKLPDILKKWIPHISLNSGIIKGRESWINLTTDIKSQASVGRNLPEDIKKDITRILKTLAPLEAIKESGTHSEFISVLKQIISSLDFSDEDTNLGEHLEAILNELSFLDSVRPENKIGLHQFMENLQYILSTTELEKEGIGVHVAGFFELRNTEPEYLYFGGLKDGDLPSMPDIDHLLPDNVRTMLGLVNMKKYLHLQKFLFHRLTASSLNIHLSYHTMEADKLFLPSPFLPWKNENREKIPGILCKEEDLLRSGDKPLTSKITEISAVRSNLINKRFGKKAGIRVTDIDYYRICPRKFFIEKILDLEPSRIKEYEIEVMLLGTIAHRVMEALMQKAFNTFDEFRANAEDSLAKILHEQPLEDYWKSLFRESFLAILPEIYEIETKLKDEGYTFTRSEASVEGEVLKDIRLKGKVDRIDSKNTGRQLQTTSPNEVQLIDYKTGSIQFSGTDILKKGASLQLFLYSAIMKTLGLNVNRTGIYSLKDLSLKWIPGRTDKRYNITMDDYIKSSLKYLEETVATLRNGDFIALPMNEQACRKCHESPYCPFIQN